MRTIEIFSATDPPHLANRQVRYWGEFDGARTAALREWGPINDWAQKLCAGSDDIVICDRSDRDSGYLRAVLRGERPYGN